MSVKEALVGVVVATKVFEATHELCVCCNASCSLSVEEKRSSHSLTHSLSLFLHFIIPSLDNKGR